MAMKEVEKFNSNMIHSTVAEYIPYSSRISRDRTDRGDIGESGDEGDEREQGDEGMEGVEGGERSGRGREGGGNEAYHSPIITIKDRKKERKDLNFKNNLAMRRIDSMTSISSPKNEETYRNRLLLLPKNKGDCLGTHFTKKTNLKSMKNKNKNDTKNVNKVEIKDVLLKSDEILEKTSHLTRQNSSHSHSSEHGSRD